VASDFERGRKKKSKEAKMSQFDEDYFLRGKETGVSLYEDYRWLGHLTVPMVLSMVEHLDISRNDTILDFGCARGYSVRAFRELGYEAYGVDISEWAILNADEVSRPFVSCTDKIPPLMDWIIAKDVLEHIYAVADLITELMEAAKIGVFAVVPLAPFDHQPYAVADYEKDVTHIHRLSLATWARLFMRPGWTVEASYRVRGVKDNYNGWDNGNGFITARRL
jgi:SAM-dependent methyltransferase